MDHGRRKADALNDASHVSLADGSCRIQSYIVIL